MLQTPVKTFLCPAAPGGMPAGVSGSFTFGVSFPFADIAVTDYATCSSINTNSITFFGYPSRRHRVRPVQFHAAVPEGGAAGR